MELMEKVLIKQMLMGVMAALARVKAWSSCRRPCQAAVAKKHFVVA